MSRKEGKAPAEDIEEKKPDSLGEEKKMEKERKQLRHQNDELGQQVDGGEINGKEMLHKVEAEMSRSKSKEKTKEYVEGKDEKTDEERKGRKEVRVPDLLVMIASHIK